MTKSNTNRFVGAAWSLLTFQFLASVGAVAVSAWAVFEVQPRLAQLQAMQRRQAPETADATPAPAQPAAPAAPSPPQTAPSPPQDAPPSNALQMPPMFGSIDLRAGEERSLDVRAGGEFDASRIGATCAAGFITEQPSFVLRYTAGGLPLNIGVVSQGDATIIVRAPDGSWLCNDDADGGRNPRASWQSPASGAYLIWVGHYGAANQFDSAMLYMSHRTPGTIQ